MRASDTYGDEIHSYYNHSVPPVKDNPLQWWKLNKDRYPAVARVAQKYLGAPATSVPSESLFSTAGNIVTKKRTRLCHETIRDIVFLHENMSYLLHFFPQ